MICASGSVQSCEREHAIFELVDEDKILLDVSKNDQGVVEIAFHDAIRGRIIELETLQRLLVDGSALATRDE